jgi:hypothetical protein
MVVNTLRDGDSRHDVVMARIAVFNAAIDCSAGREPTNAAPSTNDVDKRLRSYQVRFPCLESSLVGRNAVCNERDFTPYS